MAVVRSQNSSSNRPIGRYCGMCGESLSRPKTESEYCTQCGANNLPGGETIARAQVPSIKRGPVRRDRRMEVAIFAISGTISLGIMSVFGLFTLRSAQAAEAIKNTPVTMPQTVDLEALLPRTVSQVRTKGVADMGILGTLAVARKDTAYQRVNPSHPALKGLIPPINGLDGVPQSQTLFPGAPRTYRHGHHEGVDFYPEGRWNSVVKFGTEVIAVKSGVIDEATTVDYQEMSHSEHRSVLDFSHSIGFTPMNILLKLRGRTIWIDHGNGLKSVYAHLKGISPDVRPGERVEQGQVIGYVGNSGTTNGVNGTVNDFHLHFELWLNGQIAGYRWKASDFQQIFPFGSARSNRPVG